MLPQQFLKTCQKNTRLVKKDISYLTLILKSRKRSSQRKGSEIALLKKKRSNENRKLIDKQRNKSVSLLRKVKKDYFTS